jgi:hypothetical protein
MRVDVSRAALFSLLVRYHDGLGPFDFFYEIALFVMKIESWFLLLRVAGLQEGEVPFTGGGHRFLLSERGVPQYSQLLY